MDGTDLTWLPLADGARVAAVVHGDPDGPPVVVVPGLSDGLAPLSEPATREALPPPPRELRDRWIVQVSFREPLPEAPTTTGLADDLIEVVELVAPGRPVMLAAHSMGAMVAQHVAGRRPDLVRRLVMSAAVPSVDTDLEEVLERWDELVRQGRFRAFMRDAVDVSYTGADRIRRLVWLRLTRAPDLSEHVGRHLALSHACRTHDARDLLGAIECPTLVLAGEDDPLTRHDRAQELADAIPDARLVSFPGLSHGFPEQARRRYVEELVRFVGP